MRLYSRVSGTNQQVRRITPDRSQRSRGTRCPARIATPPPPRGSPAPRSSPGHPSERREGRWCGARGTGARSEPWRPPPAGREEKGVEPGRIPREVELTRTGRQPSSAASVDSAHSARAALCPGLKTFETPGVATRTRPPQPHLPTPALRGRPAADSASRRSPPHPPPSSTPLPIPAQPFCFRRRSAAETNLKPAQRLAHL